MNLNDIQAVTMPNAIEAEKSVLGALLIDNEAIYRVHELRKEHFYDFDNAEIYGEILKQITAGNRCDALTVFDAIGSKITDCLPYLTSLTTNALSSANIAKYANIVIDRAIKRSLIMLGGEIQCDAGSANDAYEVIDKYASKLEQFAQKKVKQDPELISDMLMGFVDLIQARIDGKIKPVATGYQDLDKRLVGGLERGTLTVIAGRPAMGKTAMALAICRNVAEWGTSLFLSMEMSKAQVNDRNIAALGKIPVSWLRYPSEDNIEYWDRLTHAFQRAEKLSMFIDDETSLSMMDIRAKARMVKRKKGLDLLVVDQLSFITGGDAENKAYELGEYTRGFLAIAKELDCAVVLLAQLNRKCEDRSNKRPLMSDLSSSGSIEQDASNVIFLYRDEVYNPDSRDRGVCEVITTKQRQGEPGTVALAYIGAETRFEDLGRPWVRNDQPEVKRGRGFD